MNQTTKILISPLESGERLDSFLAKKYPDFSRSHFSNLIKTREIKVNHAIAAKPSYILKENDELELIIAQKATSQSLKPQQIDLDIIYEDENVIVINKQPNLVVHPGAGNPENTLVNALVYYLPEIKDAVYDKKNPISLTRPGLVHRLDKDTSGVIIIAKNPRAMHSLARQIQNRTVKKSYLSINYGWPRSSSGEITNNIARNSADRKVFSIVDPPLGKEAITSYEVKKLFTDASGRHYSQMEFDIKTGRTHQIRVHSKFLHIPVMGDSTYGHRESLLLSQLYKIERQLLHAHKLVITLPGDDKASTFVAPIPKDFLDFSGKLTEIDPESI